MSVFLIEKLYMLQRPSLGGAVQDNLGPGPREDHEDEEISRGNFGVFSVTVSISD